MHQSEKSKSNGPQGIRDLRARSGNIKSKDKLVGFLYILMRDYLPTGKIEEIMQGHVYPDGMLADFESIYTNGWLAQYAKDLANRLR